MLQVLADWLHTLAATVVGALALVFCGFATWRVCHWLRVGAAAAVANQSITNRPAFDVGDAQEMLRANATEDDVFLALAKHVPALSSPVGGMNVTLLVNGIDMNLSLSNGGVPKPNGWGRGDDTFYQQRWLHSDMKDMAFFYVYKLYEQLIQKGNLK